MMYDCKPQLVFVSAFMCVVVHMWQLLRTEIKLMISVGLWPLSSVVYMWDLHRPYRKYLVPARSAWNEVHAGLASNLVDQH